MILEGSVNSPERRESAGADADEPSPRSAGPLLFLWGENTARKEDVREGSLRVGRGDVYAEDVKDGSGRNCFSISSTGLLNTQLDPVIDINNDGPVG